MDVEYDKTTPAIELSLVYNTLPENNIKIIRNQINTEIQLIRSRINPKYNSPHLF